jgi:hypothetical protein
VLGKQAEKDDLDQEYANVVTVDQRIKDKSSLCSTIKAVITSESWVFVRR